MFGGFFVGAQKEAQKGRSEIVLPIRGATDQGATQENWLAQPVRV